MKPSNISPITNSERIFESFTLELEEYVITLTVDKGDELIQSLNEAKQKGSISLGGIYSATLHKVPDPGMTHLHVYAKNNQLFALNIDGSAHDASHKTQIPNKVAAAITANFPNFILPKDNFIESVSIAKNLSLRMDFLLE